MAYGCLSANSQAMLSVLSKTLLLPTQAMLMLLPHDRHLSLPARKPAAMWPVIFVQFMQMHVRTLGLAKLAKLMWVGRQHSSSQAKLDLLSVSIHTSSPPRVPGTM